MNKNDSTDKNKNILLLLVLARRLLGPPLQRCRRTKQRNSCYDRPFYSTSTTLLASRESDDIVPGRYKDKYAGYKY